ncbi:hypothetical protein [Rhizobium laguerreae]|uniref:Uncharacterized protein n=1 Tax=Rhizobium laguerreae TaxID=1076926 RepID=A0A6N9ZR01_9HYPH|nr:hypothetical protein [Rhizobium laguerreae]NEH95696.1 hypothetical protein [Rhizobium laguerreae]
MDVLSMPQMQPAPNKSQPAVAPKHSLGDGGGPTRFGPLESGLSDSDRLKAALHRQVLVLPLLVIIFQQMLRDPTQTVELPVVKVKVPLESVLPIFLMIIAYLLFRAMRYARIVLWNIVHPEQVNSVAQIALDDGDTYKLNKAYYEETVDSMAAAFAQTLRRNLKSSVGEFVARTSLRFVVLRSLVVYALIFGLLLAIASNITGTLVKSSVWASRSLIDGNTIEAFVLAVSAILLLLSWLNAAVVVLTMLWLVLRLAARTALAVKTIFVAAVRFPFRALYELATTARERHRGKILAAQKLAYERRIQQHVNSQEHREYLKRKNLFDFFAEEISDRTIFRYVAYAMLYGGSSFSGKIAHTFRLPDLAYCRLFFQALSKTAPADFFHDEAKILQEKFCDILDSYDVIDPSESAITSWEFFGSEYVKKQTVEKEILAHLEKIEPRAEDLVELSEALRKKGQQYNLGSQGELNDDELSNLAKEARHYFKKDELENSGFKEAPPVRGADDWRLTTYAIELLRTIAGISTKPTETGSTA